MWEVELWWIWRTVGKIGWVGPATVDAFWSCANGFSAFPHCMWLIKLDALMRLTTEVQWMAERLAVKNWRTGLVLLYFSHCMMQWYTFLITSTSHTSVPGWKVTTNIGYLVITVCVALSVFVIWEIFTTCNSWAIKSAYILLTEMLSGMTSRTTHGWMVSGSGYVW